MLTDAPRFLTTRSSHRQTFPYVLSTLSFVSTDHGIAQRSVLRQEEDGYGRGARYPWPGSVPPQRIPHLPRRAVSRFLYLDMGRIWDGVTGDGERVASGC